MNLSKILADHKLWLSDEGGSRAILRGANLRGADLQHAYLRHADLRGANLQYANLRGADLRYANLQGADLRAANWQDADLRAANWRYADLQGANLRDADLRHADLQYANLLGAKLPSDFLIVTTEKYLITQHKGVLRIGCESHTLDYWANNASKMAEQHDESLEDVERWIKLGTPKKGTKGELS